MLIVLCLVVFRFNRYIVECKVRFLLKALTRTMDLIDTLWNVKVAEAPDAVVAPFRFNRYIVECKAAENRPRVFPLLDLIDTLWNVKFKLCNLFHAVF